MLLYYHRAKVQKLSHLCSAFKNNSYLCGMNDIELIKNKIYEIHGQETKDSPALCHYRKWCTYAFKHSS